MRPRIDTKFLKYDTYFRPSFAKRPAMCYLGFSNSRYGSPRIFIWQFAQHMYHVSLKRIGTELVFYIY